MKSSKVKKQRAAAKAEQPECKLCHSETELAFSKATPAGKSISYYQCKSCFSLQTYFKGSSNKEKFEPSKVSKTLKSFFCLPQLLEILEVKKEKFCLDIDSSSGLFTRLMRDMGFNFYACHDKTKEIFSQGFSDKKLEQNYHLLTLLNVVEFFKDPDKEWKSVFDLDPEWVLISTPIYLNQGSDWKNLTLPQARDQLFYSADALAQVAQKYNRTAYSLGPFTMMSKQALNHDTINQLRVWQKELPSHQITAFQAWSKISEHFGYLDQYNLSKPD